jgi:hypothetical protein
MNFGKIFLAYRYPAVSLKAESRYRGAKMAIRCLGIVSCAKEENGQQAKRQ